MNRTLSLVAALAVSWAAAVRADWTDATCEIYPIGEDHTDVLIPCTFSQSQGYVTITRSDGVTHELSPVSNTPDIFEDQHGDRVTRQSGLGDQGVIFRLPSESIFIYWNISRLEPRDADNATWPFTIGEYDATALFRCKVRQASEFDRCPGGILRMEDNRASIVVQSPLGEQFTINFMKDYINATNREVEARLDGDTWILTFANGELWEIPLAAIEGG